MYTIGVMWYKYEIGIIEENLKSGKVAVDAWAVMKQNWTASSRGRLRRGCSPSRLYGYIQMGDREALVKYRTKREWSP